MARACPLFALALLLLIPDNLEACRPCGRFGRLCRFKAQSQLQAQIRIDSITQPQVAILRAGCPSPLIQPGRTVFGYGGYQAQTDYDIEAAQQFYGRTIQQALQGLERLEAQAAARAQSQPNPAGFCVVYQNGQWKISSVNPQSPVPAGNGNGNTPGINQGDPLEMPTFRKLCLGCHQAGGNGYKEGNPIFELPLTDKLALDSLDAIQAGRMPKGGQIAPEQMASILAELLRARRQAPLSR